MRLNKRLSESVFVFHGGSTGAHLSFLQVWKQINDNKLRCLLKIYHHAEIVARGDLLLWELENLDPETAQVSASYTESNTDDIETEKVNAADFPLGKQQQSLEKSTSDPNSGPSMINHALSRWEEMR